LDERIIAILFLIARQIVTGADLNEEGNELILTISAQGFIDFEVEQALDWIEEIRQPMDLEVEGDENRRETNRILSTEESYRVLPAAFGYLLKLKNMGIVDDLLMEEILEKAQESEFEEVGKDELRLIAIFTLYQRDALSDWRRIIKHILDGGWESMRH
jgi:Smg protein